MPRWRLAADAAKEGRYGNVERPTVDGIRFDSKAEMQRYLELKLLERAGEIRDLELQPRFPIVIGEIEIRIRRGRYRKTGRHVTYVADFRYFDCRSGRVIIEDVKMKSGHRDRVYLLKKAMAEAMGLEITEV